MLPNEKGQYWDPFVLINSFYSINNQYIEINKFLRKNFLKIKSYDFYLMNENIQKVIRRNIEKTENHDYKELKDALNNRDINNKTKAMLAFGISTKKKKKKID